MYDHCVKYFKLIIKEKIATQFNLKNKSISYTTYRLKYYKKNSCK